VAPPALSRALARRHNVRSPCLPRLAEPQSAASPGASEGGTRYTAELHAAGRQAPQPTLYLHGANDGCVAAGLAARAGPFLAPSSRMSVIDGAGHFLHLEKPDEVNSHILTWVTS
jgi:pimeloyl-ACP methyl ester carboxylesterase